MQRRQLLSIVGTSMPIAVGGCIQSPGGDGDGNGSSDVPVTIVSQADQPDAPIEYDVEMIRDRATDDVPARVGVTITNTTDEAVVLGEERAVQFHHVSSTDDELYLHPAGEEAEWEGPVEPGCWQLTDHVAVPEYYGTIRIDPDVEVQGQTFVYGHPDLAEGSCLPEGDHEVVTSGVYGGEDEEVTDGDAEEFEWGFTLNVGE